MLPLFSFETYSYLKAVMADSPVGESAFFVIYRSLIKMVLGKNWGHKIS
jgi:hypothetical protein